MGFVGIFSNVANRRANGRCDIGNGASSEVSWSTQLMIHFWFGSSWMKKKYASSEANGISFDGSTLSKSARQSSQKPSSTEATNFSSRTGWKSSKISYSPTPEYFGYSSRMRFADALNKPSGHLKWAHPCSDGVPPKRSISRFISGFMGNRRARRASD